MNGGVILMTKANKTEQKNREYRFVSNREKGEKVKIEETKRRMTYFTTFASLQFSGTKHRKKKKRKQERKKP